MRSPWWMGVACTDRKTSTTTRCGQRLAGTRLVWALILLPSTLAFAEEEHIQALRSPPFLQPRGRRAAKCHWQCEQNGADCDPGDNNACDCVAHGCGNPEVAYSAAQSSEEIGSRSDSLVVIPVILVVVFLICCCAFIFMRTTDDQSHNDSSSPRGWGSSLFLNDKTSIYRHGNVRHQKKKETQGSHGSASSGHDKTQSAANTGVAVKMDGVAGATKVDASTSAAANTGSRSRSPSPKFRPISNPTSGPVTPGHSPRSRAGSPSTSTHHSPRPTATSSNRSRSPKPRLDTKGLQRNGEDQSETSSNRSRSPKSRLDTKGLQRSNEDQSETSSNRSRSPKVHKEKTQSKRERSASLKAAAEYDVEDLFVCRASQKRDTRTNGKTQKSDAVSDVSTGIGTRTTISRDVASSFLSVPVQPTSALAAAADASLDATLSTAGQHRLSATLERLDTAIGIAASSPRTRKK